MLVAPPRPSAPEGDWLPILGSQWRFAPIDRPMLMRARRAARAASQDASEEGEHVGSPIDPIAAIEEMGDAMSRALIMDGAREWRDVAAAPVDGDDEPVFEPLEFTAENLAFILSDPVIFEAVDEAYVVPFVLRERARAEPGNVFTASPSGTGEAGTPESGTAISPARRSRAGGAGSARTSSKSRGTKRKKASGAS